MNDAQDCLRSGGTMLGWTETQWQRAVEYLRSVGCYVDQSDHYTIRHEWQVRKGSRVP